MKKNKLKQNRIRKIIKQIIILVIFMILIYIFWGMNREDKIALVEKNEINIQAEEIVIEENQENVKREEVHIEESYLGYNVSSKLIIPKINLETYVLEDYTIEGMNVCASKYWGPDANEIGNFCIAGHNYKKDNMFYNLIDLNIGDELYLLDNKNGKYTYTIYNIYKVKPKNISPLDQETNGKRIVTLITCVNYTDNRLIVQAVQS